LGASQAKRYEEADTYRFKSECEKWYGREIETITNPEYNDIEEVWIKYKSLNVATGAICSTELKRVVREKFQKENNFSYQAFGFEIEEVKRAKGLKLNHSDSKPIFPLIAELLSKRDCIKIVQAANDIFLQIELPRTYKLGYLNNNCFNRGCVQGGIGYWQKLDREETAKVERMAKVEHYLTDLKGEPVTMLKNKDGLIFLRPHPNYPNIQDISTVKGREPKPLLECNGFCGTNDLQPNETEKELNYETSN